jgi:hypothetical protein
MDNHVVMVMYVRWRETCHSTRQSFAFEKHTLKMEGFACDSILWLGIFKFLPNNAMVDDITL